MIPSPALFRVCSFLQTLMERGLAFSTVKTYKWELLFHHATKASGIKLFLVTP